jgi:hypothetical protein
MDIVVPSCLTKQTTASEAVGIDIYMNILETLKELI